MKYVLVIGLLVLLLGFVLYRSQTTKPVVDDDKKMVVTSFYPLYFFTNAIAGNLVTVVNLTSSGVDPHDFEPSATDIARIERSDLLILNGAGFEAWADRFPALKVADSITTITHEHEGEVETDPHVWLDPILAKTIVTTITKELQRIDPKNATTFEQNQQRLLTDLDNLDREYSATLTTCNKNTVITSHEAFGYLAKRYNFAIESITGISPEEEPSPQQLATIANLAREKNVKYIFSETLLNPRLAETVATEVGAEVLTFNPLEGLTEEELSRDEDYVSIQRNNIKNLATALECR